MPFTVVSTLRTQDKNIIKEFSAVPSTWINGNQLLWPQSDSLANFIKDQNSVPHPSWSSHLCCIHRKNIKTFDEAVMWEAKFAELDSDNDDDSNNSPKKISPPPEPPLEQSYKSCNDLFKNVNGSDQDDDDVLIKEELISIEDLDEDIEDIPEVNCQCQKITHDAIMEMKAELVSIKNLLEQQKQQNLKTDMTLVRSTIATNEQDFSTKFTFPIDSADELRDLDHAIGENDDYRKYLIERFGRICGTGGNVKSANKIAVKLVSDLLFSKALLTNFSWTGKTRTTYVHKKLPFGVFNNIVGVVDEILNNCDSRWNLMDTEHLFREKLLKHASKRMSAEMEKRERSIRIKTTTKTMRVTTTNFNSNISGNTTTGNKILNSSYNSEKKSKF